MPIFYPWEFVSIIEIRSHFLRATSRNLIVKTRSTDRLIISIWKENEESSGFDEIHRSRTFSKFRFETRADRSDRFGQARFREIPRRLCIGVSRWMDPCPVIREPLSGARDRTTLGQTSAPIIVLTVQLYTYVEWSVHTACPENSSIASLKISPAVLFSSQNYACNLHSGAIKFLNGGKETGMFVVGSKRRNGWMENNKILRGKEICRGYRGNVSFIIRRIRGTTRSARFETPCVAPYTRVFSWKRESMRMHMYTVRLLLDFDA